MTGMAIDTGEASDAGLGIGPYIRSALSFFRFGKPETLYHGSGRELEGGDALVPHEPGDVGDNPDNKQTGVYATGTRNYAIAMGFISCKGNRITGLKPRLGIKGWKIKGIIYHGDLPEQEHFYLHTLPSDTFEKSGLGQWVSEEAVVPCNTETLKVSDYKHLFRIATPEEKTHFYEKHHDDLVSEPTPAENAKFFGKYGGEDFSTVA